MSRAAFLPSTGDPYSLLHTVRYFHKVWSSEVDTLYVKIASQYNEEVIQDLMRQLKHPKIKVSFLKTALTHGENLRLTLKECNEDIVLFIEDDSIVFKSGIIDKYFSLIEQGNFDCIGSPRMSCHLHIAEEAKKRFGLDYSGFGDKGPAFWPCFFWAKKEDLLKTDLNFCARTFLAGEKLFDFTFTETAGSDTMVWMSLQLRNLGLKILEIPQYHCSPDDEENKKHNRSIFDGQCGYMHFGSLSSGIQSYLATEENVPLAYIEHVPPPKALEFALTTKAERFELARRIAWWSTCVQKVRSIDAFHDLYQKAIKRVIKKGSFSQEEINNWTDLYKLIIGEVFNAD